MRSVAGGALAAATVWAAFGAVEAWLGAPARARVVLLGRASRSADGGASWLSDRLADAAVPGPARRWVAGWAGAVIAAMTIGWRAGGLALAVVAALAVACAPWLALSARQGRRGAAIEAALPPVLEATARGLRAGASLPTAIAAAATGAAPAVAADLVGVTAAAPQAGLVAALDWWAAERPLPGVRLAAAALALAAEVGGGGARALDGVALTLRQRQATAGEVRALATQARLSAGVLTLAPLAFAALAAAADGRTAAVLLRSPLGQGCLAAGLGLDAVGALWMARITRAGAA